MTIIGGLCGRGCPGQKECVATGGNNMRVGLAGWDGDGEKPMLMSYPGSEVDRRSVRQQGRESTCPRRRYERRSEGWWPGSEDNGATQS